LSSKKNFATTAPPTQIIYAAIRRIAAHKFKVTVLLTLVIIPSASMPDVYAIFLLVFVDV
jgi:hypothetical protein